MSPSVPNPDAWFDDAYGFPRPNWTLFEDWILTEADAEQFDAAWDGVTENWLRRMQKATGGRFCFAESASFHLLSPHSERECVRMLEVAERAYGRINNTLGELLNVRFGRIVVLRFREADDYYRYVSYFHAEDQEHPMSGGMFIPDGFPHVICHSEMFEQFCPTLAHELSHLLVAHLSLPSWVNEGLAMSFEGEFGHSHLPNGEQIKKHRAHWNEDTIQAFWSGDTFQTPGEVFGLGYELAALLFDIIRTELKPPPEAFRAFVQSADRADGGAASARVHLRTELSELVEVFLGPGRWEPRPGT